MGDRSRLERLFSLSGVVPLGAFVLLHLWAAAALLSSHAAYDRQLGWLHASPASAAIVTLLEVVLVLVPLVFHAGYGIVKSLSRPAEDTHHYESDLMRSLERVTGVMVLAFVLWHVWQTRLPSLTGRLAVGSYSTSLVAQLSTTSAGIPWTAFGYLAGLAATMFHLVNGMSSFLLSRNATGSFAGRARLRLLVKALGILFFAVSSATVIELATGTRFVPAEQTVTTGSCGTAANPAPSALPGASP